MRLRHFLVSVLVLATPAHAAEAELVVPSRTIYPGETISNAMLGMRDGAEVVATASAFRLGLSELEADLAEQSTPDVARTLLIYVVGHTQATQLHRQAAAVGAIALDPDLDASFDRGLAIILH